MEVLGWLLIGILVVLAVLLILLSIAVRERHHAVLLVVGAIALFAGATISGVIRVELPSPAPIIGWTGKDFYQVRWEEKTIRGTTIVVVKDSSGEFYFSEFDEPLGVKKVLVIEKERFKSLLLSEKPGESKKVVPVPKK